MRSFWYHNLRIENQFKKMRNMNSEGFAQLFSATFPRCNKFRSQAKTTSKVSRAFNEVHQSHDRGSLRDVNKRFVTCKAVRRAV